MPVSIYRLQLSSSFTFRNVADIIPYLSTLGVTHIYLSPILQAGQGSTHGYDVVDHSQISQELGGINEFYKLSNKAKQHQMGLVVDIVPNHMAIPTPIYHNHQLWDVLIKGTDSCYSHWFDIDWSAEDSKLVLPVLQKHIAQVIANGELVVENRDISHNGLNVITKVLSYNNNVFPLRAGTEDLPLVELLERQFYRLSYWEVAEEELNYRRFFDIGTFLALNIDNEDVFCQTHRIIAELVNGGMIDGLRIDHIDGLANPDRYLERLYQATGGVWTVVEKVLGSDEELDSHWKTCGTTGYDSLNMVHHAMLNQHGQSKLRAISGSFNRESENLQAHEKLTESERTDVATFNITNTLINNSKRQILNTLFYADLYHLSETVHSITRIDIAFQDYSWRSINTCLIELLVYYPVYRPYINLSEGATRTISNQVYKYIKQTVQQAENNLDAQRILTLHFIEQLLLGNNLLKSESADSKKLQQFRELHKQFIIQFSGLCVATNAKGIEDTAFYRFTTLISLCEVGGELDNFSHTLHAFHSYCLQNLAHQPYTVIASTTHDTKRSEDVRAQLGVLSQNTDVWDELLHNVQNIAAKYHTLHVDSVVENLMWQTIAGTWTPTLDGGYPIEFERLKNYLIKAMREAKVYTTWRKQNIEYEEAVLKFAKHSLADEQILDKFRKWCIRQYELLRAEILTAKAISLLMPGIPDVYQGTESLHLLLVDPDNRRSVDFAYLEQMLERIRNHEYNPDLPPGLVDNQPVNFNYHIGSIEEQKLLITFTALCIRKDYRDAFIGQHAGYQAISTTSDCILGFTRTYDNMPKVVVIVQRYGGTLEREGGFANHTVSLPKLPLGYNRWIDRLTGKAFKVGDNKLTDIFDTYPVVILEAVQSKVKQKYLQVWSPTAKSVELIVFKNTHYDSNKTLREMINITEHKTVKMCKASIRNSQLFPENDTTFEIADPTLPITATTSLIVKSGSNYNDNMNSHNNYQSGWWISSEPVKMNRDYLYLVDGNEYLSDPRSLRQPYGVEGFSQTTLLNDFKFSDLAWTGIDSRGKIFYELHVGTFTPEGTFEAATEKLGYLKALGVDIIEIMPVSTFKGKYGWGYDGVNLYAVYETYGGPEKLQRFVNAAHNFGIGVCLDVVYNHLGPTGNNLSKIAPYYTDAHSTPWGFSFNFDGDASQGVRSWVLDHAIYCFDWFHIDCLRLDATHEVHDDSLKHILTELSELVKNYATNTGRQVSIIAESDTNNSSILAPIESRGNNFDLQWADDFHHALWAYLSKEQCGYYADFGSIDTLCKALQQGWVYDGQYSTYRMRNHGTPLLKDLDLRRFVVFFSNHDQIGNRRLGDRPGATLSDAKLKQAATLTLLSAFTPLLFQGEEFNASTPFQFFADYQDSNIMDSCRSGRQSEFKDFGWDEFYHTKYGEPVTMPDPISEQAFISSKLNWGEINSSNHKHMYQWYRQLIHIRKQFIGSTPIYQGDVQVKLVPSANQEQDGVLVMQHSGIAVVCNFSSCQLVAQLLDLEQCEVLLSSDPDVNIWISETELQLAPDSVTVFSIVKH